MKKTISILAAGLLLLLSACTDENKEARTPVAKVTVSETNLGINESMEIIFEGTADQVVIYTGDDSHDYELRSESNTGFVVDKNMFTYSYSVPGNFKVVCLASTYDTYLGNGLRTDTTSFVVTVTDDETTIETVYSPITPNTYYAELIDDVNWVLRVPTKQVYKSKEVTLNTARQRLGFEINSDSSKIYVDGTIHSTNTYYNLGEVHDIHVTSDAGTTRDYQVHTLVYGEFDSVTADGASGSLTRNAYYQDLLTYSFTLPDGSDATSVVLEFTLDDNVTMYEDGVEVTSGSTVDLTKDEDTYTLVRVSTENSDVTATSRLVFETSN